MFFLVKDRPDVGTTFGQPLFPCFPSLVSPRPIVVGRSGTTNLTGVLEVETTASGAQCVVERIIALVEDAQARKAPGRAPPGAALTKDLLRKCGFVGSVGFVFFGCFFGKEPLT